MILRAIASPFNPRIQAQSSSLRKCDQTIKIHSSGVSRATRRLMRKNAYREIVQPVLQKPFGEADLGCASIR